MASDVLGAKLNYIVTILFISEIEYTTETMSVDTATTTPAPTIPEPTKVSYIYIFSTF